MRRTLLRRVVDSSGFSFDHHSDLFDMRLAAWGAAVETLQIDLVAKGWMDLFAALLEPHPSTELRWLGPGPGVNAEIRRAYSALFGRFFARAALRRYHKCYGLQQVQDGLELAPGIELRRKRGAGYSGDLPDWVGWDWSNNCFVVAEAKGSHHKGNWYSAIPPAVNTAIRQLDRVEIVDGSGPIAFKTWAVASRWATSENQMEPTLIAYDPVGEGRRLSESERISLRTEVQARWIASLLDGLGRPDLANMARDPDASDEAAPDRDITFVAGRAGYAALAMAGGGLLPLVGPDRPARTRAFVETALGLGRQLAVILLDHKVASRAIARDKDIAGEWLADDGQGSEVDITIDGVTFRASAEDLDFA